MKYEEAILLVEGNPLAKHLSYHESKGYIIISANRSEKSDKENRDNYNELHRLLKNSKYSFKKVFGGSLEENGKDKNGNPLFKEIQGEPSFIVYANTKNGEKVSAHEVFKFGKQLAAKFNQFSIYYKDDKGSKPRWFNPNLSNTSAGEITNFEKKVRINSNETVYDKKLDKMVPLDKYYTDFNRSKNGTSKRFNTRMI